MRNRPLQLVVLSSGRGSNLAAIVDAIEAGRCEAEILAVLSDRKTAYALTYAAEKGIHTIVVPLNKGDDREEWNVLLRDSIAALNPDLIVLAGFMRVLSPTVVKRFENRIINVHPSLLPAFPGHDATEQAIAAGVQSTGCSVHIVDEGVDTGPTLAQATVQVLPTDDARTLHRRIQDQEHRVLPEVIHRIATGQLELPPSNPPTTEPPQV